jgi:hypothetical protein
MLALSISISLLFLLILLNNPARINAAAKTAKTSAANNSKQQPKKTTTISKCEQRISPSQFSAEQRKEICKVVLDKGDVNAIGPALCSVEAKKSLRLTNFDDIVSLCANATSTRPIACMEGLDTNERKKYGIELCRGATSALPADCYKSLAQNGLLSSLTGGKGKMQKSQELLAFCNVLDDTGKDFEVVVVVVVIN